MLRIRGGVGGLSFQFEELLAGAAALDGLVRELAAWRRRPTPCGAPCSRTSPTRTPAAAMRSSPSGREPGPSAASGWSWRVSAATSGRATGSTSPRRPGTPCSCGSAGPAPAYGPLWGLFGLPPVTVRDTVEDEVAAGAREAGAAAGPAGRPGSGRGPGGRCPGRGPRTGGRAGPGVPAAPAGPDRGPGNPDGGGRRLTGRAAAAGRGRRPEQRGDRGPPSWGSPAAAPGW